MSNKTTKPIRKVKTSTTNKDDMNASKLTIAVIKQDRPKLWAMWALTPDEERLADWVLRRYGEDLLEEAKEVCAEYGPRCSERTNIAFRTNLFCIAGALELRIKRDSRGYVSQLLYDLFLRLVTQRNQGNRCSTGGDSGNEEHGRGDGASAGNASPDTLTE